MHDTEGLRRDENGGSITMSETIQENDMIPSKSNLESDYLMVQFIYK